MKILFVANKKLPNTDYRVQYAQQSKKHEVFLGLPGCPDGFQKTQFVSFGFGEGLRLRDFYWFVHLYRYLKKKTNLTCVHFSATVLVLFGPYIAAVAKKPCLVTVTGFGRIFNNKKLRYRILRPIYWLILSGVVRISRKILLQNYYDLKILKEKFPKYSDRFSFIGSGIASKKLSIERIPKSSGCLRVIHVARILPDKGIFDFLEVASRLAGDNYQFRLIGPSANGGRHALQAVHAAHQRRQISYVGELLGKELQQEYREADVLLFPSAGEGLSRVMLEAGFAGLIPVGYKIPSNRDLVKEGCGFLVDTGSIEGLTAKLRLLSSSPQICRDHAEGYQRHITENYSMSSFSDRMDDILKSMELTDNREHQTSEKTNSQIRVNKYCRQGEINDLKQIVRIHESVFPDFFLTSLGLSFLYQYYRLVLNDPSGVINVLVDANESKIIGFAAGSLDIDLFYKKMRNRWYKFILPIITATITRPTLVLKVLSRTVRILFGAHPQKKRITTPKKSGELSSLAILPHYQGNGLGRRLTSSFLEECWARGAQSISLTTDLNNNAKVIKFYESIGFKRTGEKVGETARPLLVFEINSTKKKGAQLEKTI